MHIGFGQNTVSSLYGHQKGDHMKTIELSHKKHKANAVSYTHLDVYKRQPRAWAAKPSCPVPSAGERMIRASPSR